MTTTSVADVIECGGRVTLEQVLIFVDVPLIVLFTLAVVLTALISMTSKVCQPLYNLLDFVNDELLSITLGITY